MGANAEAMARTLRKAPNRRAKVKLLKVALEYEQLVLRSEKAQARPETSQNAVPAP